MLAKSKDKVQKPSVAYCCREFLDAMTLRHWGLLPYSCGEALLGATSMKISTTDTMVALLGGAWLMVSISCSARKPMQAQPLNSVPKPLTDYPILAVKPEIVGGLRQMNASGSADGYQHAMVDEVELCGEASWNPSLCTSHTASATASIDDILVPLDGEHVAYLTACADSTIYSQLNDDNRQTNADVTDDGEGFAGLIRVLVLSRSTGAVREVQVIRIQNLDDLCGYITLDMTTDSRAFVVTVGGSTTLVPIPILTNQPRR
jgi:hypothetical protein